MTLSSAKLECSVVSVAFNQEILQVVSLDGVILVPIVSLVKGIGLSIQGQVSRTQKYFSESMVQVPVSDHKLMLCLPLHKINAWLHGLQIGRLSSQNRQLALLYQKDFVACVESKLAKRSSSNKEETLEESLMEQGTKIVDSLEEQISSLPVEETSKDDIKSILSDIRRENRIFQDSLLQKIDMLKNRTSHHRYSVQEFADLFDLEMTTSRLEILNWDCEILSFRKDFPVTLVINSSKKVVNAYDLSILMDAFSRIFPRSTFLS